jgi:peptidoglycan-associated lipoprotein
VSVLRPAGLLLNEGVRFPTTAEAKMKRSRHLWGVTVGLVAMLGCGKKEPPPAAAPPPVVSAAAPAPPDDAAARAREAEAAERRREAERLRSILESRVFFDYDDAAVRADARTTLEDKARVLRENPEIRLRIEGHADERGSTEYNLALGSRRASSVVSYFTGFGISATRFESVSFGEERPVAIGGDERAWSQNRRAEFVITAGMPGATESQGL